MRKIIMKVTNPTKSFGYQFYDAVTEESIYNVVGFSFKIKETKIQSEKNDIICILTRQQLDENGHLIPNGSRTGCVEYEEKTILVKIAVPDVVPELCDLPSV